MSWQTLMQVMFVLFFVWGVAPVFLATHLMHMWGEEPCHWCGSYHCKGANRPYRCYK